MKINHIKISNILGIASLEFSPEGFTQITGQNGQGKTSILEAIKSATGSGHDATLLRKGADKGEIVLVLDDGTEIQQRVTATKTTRDVVRDGKKIARPVDAIKALTDVLSINPVEFLTAKKQDRVKVLLESMPITVDTEKLSAMAGFPVQASPGMHGLAVIDYVRQQVYEDRTGTNRAVKEKDATINQLRAAMPDAVGGIEGSEDELRAQVETAQNTMRAEHARIDTKLGAMKAESATRVQALRDEARAKVDAINAELQVAIDAEREKLAENEGKAGRVRQKATDTCTAVVQPLSEAIKAIAANRDAAAKRKATMETIELMKAELTDLEDDAERQTKAIDDIDRYKIDLLSALPIPGIEVVDGEIFRDGVPFDRLNTAQRVGIAFDIAKLRAGDLRVVCIDGCELLDSEHLAAMEQQAESAGLQVFVTRVQDKEFSVDTK